MQLSPWRVGGIRLAKDLGGARLAVLSPQLPTAEPRHIEAGDIHVGPPRRDPVRDDPPQAPGGQDADRVQPRRDEVAAQPRRLRRSGVNDSGPQKNVLTPTFSSAGIRAIAA